MSERKAEKRPFVGITFECCRVYQRVYMNEEGTAYEGACPKCGRRATIKIDPKGTNCRFFRAF